VISLVVLGLLLAFIAYLVAPAVRDRLVGASPANTVGTFRRGMRALAHDDGASGSYAGASTKGSMTMPGRGARMRPLGSAAAQATTDAPVATGAVPAAQRRQMVQASLWVATGVLFVLGFLATAVWWLCGVVLVLTLAYMAAAHEAARREEERARARKLARIRETNQLRAVPTPAAARPAARVTSLDERRRAVAG
jgi:hypothetical protein